MIVLMKRGCSRLANGIRSLSSARTFQACTVVEAVVVPWVALAVVVVVSEEAVEVVASVVDMVDRAVAEGT
jgi:hypothetical protein